MLKLPRKLQQIFTFEEDGIWYVANLQTGQIIQIDSVTAAVLELGSTDNNSSILKKLGDKYSESQILESLRTLGGDLESLLFEPQVELPSPTTIRKKKLRIFVPHNFMRYKGLLSPTTNVGIYNLLTALAKYAEVFVEIDNTSDVIQQRKQLTALGIQLVSDIFESDNRLTYASNRFIINDCDGILALSPHPYEELNYFKHNSIPVVSRIYSDRNLRETTINKALSHQALRRNFDQLCPDTPWITPELTLLDSCFSEGLDTIPNGIDTHLYSPQDHQKAREVVASIIGDMGVLGAPFVGILNGFESQNGIGMIAKLAHLHRDVVFIVLDQVFAQSRPLRHHNVFYITLQRPEDTAALPLIYSACEFIIFPTVIGTPFSMVLEALACGVPMLALNSVELSEELERCLISVPVSRDNTGKFLIPTTAISEQINSILSTPSIGNTLSMNGRKIVESYSWDRTAQRFVALFTALNERIEEYQNKNYPDVAFTRYYDRAKNMTGIGAIHLDGFFKHRVEDGVAQTLLADHTPQEVRMVLQYLLEDPDEANRLLSTLGIP